MADAGRGGVLNAYGPTEAVITATVHELPDQPARAPPGVPIRRPKPGLRLYVLDKHGQPRPDWCPRRTGWVAPCWPTDTATSRS